MELTINDLKQLIGNPDSSNNGPWVVGAKYLIRTVTMTITGRLDAIYSQELYLSEAAWIADTGRFSDALNDTTKFNEVEPFANPIIVGRGAIIDATIINSLPREQK